MEAQIGLGSAATLLLVGALASAIKLFQEHKHTLQHWDFTLAIVSFVFAVLGAVAVVVLGALRLSRTRTTDAPTDTKDKPPDAQHCTKVENIGGLVAWTICVFGAIVGGILVFVRAARDNFNEWVIMLPIPLAGLAAVVFAIAMGVGINNYTDAT